MSELKPCPFCGGSELEGPNAVVGPFVQCKKCNAEGPYWRDGFTPEQEWNTRANERENEG